MIFGKGECRCTERTSKEHLPKSTEIAAFWQGSYYSCLAYSIENEILKVSVEDKGAQLKSILYKNGEVETLWQGDAKYWKGRAYNLFPIVGRLVDNKYIYDGKVYEMERGTALRETKTLS